MTTIVNNPAPAPQGDSGGNGFLIGAIIIAGFVMVLLFYGIPALRNMGPVQVNVPAPQINVPGKVDVNIVQPK